MEYPSDDDALCRLTRKPASSRYRSERLAGEIDERNFEHYPKLLEAAAFIEQSFEAVGYRPVRQEYEAQGQRFANIEVELLGQDRPQEVLVVGAHYDTSVARRGPTIMPQALRQ